MYVSMTGFSRTQLQQPWGALSAELSSVNHRYQEISVKLPREFSGWEPWFHQTLRRNFRRGKVQLRVEVLWAPTFRMGRLNRDILSSYCDELLQMQRTMGQARELELEQIVSLPGVLELPNFEESGEADKLEDVFGKLVDDAVRSWQAMRETEGAHLREDVLSHLEALEKLVNDIEARWQPARDAAFAATRARLNEMLQSLGENLEESRFLQEVVVMSDKWDVSEELARLRSHISKFRSTGGEAESSGRKLDFLVQEMNREVNTLDSKVADADIRWLAVDAKAELECIREQIQNLE